MKTNIYFTLIALFIFQNIKAQNEFSDKVKESGFINITEISYGFGSKDYNELWGFQTINGYSFNSYYSIGLGIGAEYCKALNPTNNGMGIDLIYPGGGTNFPVFANFQVRLCKKSLSPFVSCDAGYLVVLINNLLGYKGGFLASPAIGTKIFISTKTALNFSIGYRLQQEKGYSIHQATTTSNGVTPVSILNRYFILKFGFTF